MAHILRADGSTEPIEGALTLERMQTIVGGYVEVVTVGGTPRRREVLIVNDNGLNEGLWLNVVATAMYQGNPPRHSHVIVGDVIVGVLCDPGEDTERIE